VAVLRHSTLEIEAAALAAPEVLAGTLSATTVLQGLGVGVGALGVDGTAVNGTADSIICPNCWSKGWPGATTCPG
jgi:hypothetical protein